MLPVPHSGLGRRRPGLGSYRCQPSDLARVLSELRFDQGTAGPATGAVHSLFIQFTRIATYASFGTPKGRNWMRQPSDQQTPPIRPRVATLAPYRHVPAPHRCLGLRDDSDIKRPKLYSLRCNEHVQGPLLATPWQSRTGRSLR
jgi:hypothetical protein